jgi:ribonuclease Y
MDRSFAAALAGGVVLGFALGVVLWHLILAARGRSIGAITRAAREHADAERADGARHAAELRTDAERQALQFRAEAERQALEHREREDERARRELAALRDETQRELQQRRTESDRVEQRLGERELRLTEREERLRADELSVTGLREALSRRDEKVRVREAELESAFASVRRRLEEVAGLTAEEAARALRQEIEDEARTAALAHARQIRDQAERDADRQARRIIAMATQRLAAEHTAETTVAAVALPSDEMKGRIIGREGRNIRAFELATGVDVIIDDTPDTVVVSCFDPIRREVARRSLELLVADGRIHPGRIEEVVTKAQAELETQLAELGERAAYDCDVHGLHPELLKLVGRMRYRTSYGQNLYEHSKEVAWLAGMMATELKLDPALARRGGLLHDVGKVLTHEHEGTHVQLGVEVARRFGESAPVINAIEAHHDDVAHESTESVLVQAADAISGSRPGARREAFESYMKRLTRLEEIAGSHRGVEKSTVIQAGREIRVIVKPEQVDDAGAQALSESIARQIEAELQYPGQIRVTVIRETRATGVAK